MNNKIPIDEIKMVNINDDLMNRFNVILDLKGRIENQITKCNEYIKIRDKVATIADEYIYHSLMGNTYSYGEFRVLIIQGCESQINILRQSIESLEKELESKMWVNPSSVNIKNVKVIKSELE